MYCFQCAREYLDEVVECAECGVELIDEAPTPLEELGEPGDEQVAYELHAWPFQARNLTERLLRDAGVAHAWQGAALMVLAADEDDVDELIDKAERAEGPRLDPEVEHVGYSLAGWSETAQAALTNALDLAGITYEIADDPEVHSVESEDGEEADKELFVSEDDEEQVDGLFERVANRMTLEEQLGEATISMEGLELNDLLGEVRSLSSRLVKNPRDAKALLGIQAKVEVLRDIKTPFGFEGQAWVEIRSRADEIAELLGEGQHDESEVSDVASHMVVALQSSV